MIVCIYVESMVISPLLFFYCIYLILLSFLLIWLVVYFVDIFKKPAPDFIDFLKVFFVCVSLSPSVLLLVISCLLLPHLALSILMIWCEF